MANATASYSPRYVFFESSKKQTFVLLTAGIFYFWQVLESSHKFIMKIHVLQCLF